MQKRPLGTSELEVSRLSLGSWRTFERLAQEDGLAVMRAAREAGITFLDDARYNDETGAAPIATGYSEVVFGELFRAAGWDRSSVVVSNKLWWEFWPTEDAGTELDGSLGRMGFEYVDLIYANPPPAGLPVVEMVAAVAGLVASGKARAWGIVNWEAELFAEAVAAASSLGVPTPCAAQLPYSMVRRDWLEGEMMSAALSDSGAGVVASFVMAGGVLTGKYSSPGASGRAAGSALDSAAVEQGQRVASLAAEFGISPAALAIAFALANPVVATVLFGATSPAQIAENVLALDVPAAAVEAVLAN
jgi:aryl-alcohol dehydrogenase-like predicted oxidoreductase